MRSVVTRLDAESNDGRMLEKEKLVGDLGGLSMFNQALLKVERVVIRDGSEPVDFQISRHRFTRFMGPQARSHIHASSKFSSRSFTKARKRPASAPSTRR